MASEKQVVANRANAKRSTGPKTETGKALSRMNAYKYGLTAETIVVGGEDPNQFDSLRAELEAQFNPRSRLEGELVDHMALQLWRIRRVATVEAALIEVGRERVTSDKRRDKMIPDPFRDEERKEIPYENTALAFRDSQDTLGTLFRYEAASRNGFDRTLHQLLFLQDRRARESDEGQIVDVLPSKADASDAA